MSEYRHARADLDPLGIIALGDGLHRQDIELMLTNDPDRDSPHLADPVCALSSATARELATRLLTLADQADDRWSTAR